MLIKSINLICFNQMNSIFFGRISSEFVTARSKKYMTASLSKKKLFQKLFSQYNTVCESDLYKFYFFHRF